jgi:uncharacterized protein RhaS with RHS repeats
VTDAYAYAPGSNRLSDITGAEPRSFSYDASGNTLARGPLSFSYDDTNRLTEAFASGLQVGRYLYNARGERVVKQANGETIHFHYDAAKKKGGQRPFSKTLLA